MPSVDHERLRFRWRTVAGALVLALTALFLFPVRADAALLSTPDAGGFYAHCNIRTRLNHAVGNEEWASCQFGGGTATSLQIVPHYSGGTYTLTAPVSTCTFSASGGKAQANWGFTGSPGNSCNGSAGSDATWTSITCNFMTIAGVNRNCTIDNWIVGGSGNPPSPFDHYSGGTDGDLLDATSGTATCSRTLTDTSAMTGQFTSSNSGQTNATVTSVDWNWGDSTTHATTANANHTYGALSTMPSGGWTATVTNTVTSSIGHFFADSSSTKTVTCQLRVDFLNPSNSTAGSTSSGATTGDSGADACTPSGWNWLNPFALVSSMFCLLKYLFIPQASTVNGLGHLWDTISSKAPFSVLIDVATYIPATFDDMQYAMSHVASNPLCGTTSGGQLPDNLSTCGGTHHPFGGSALESSTAVADLRVVMLFVITGMFVYACWRGVGEVLK